MLECCSQRTAGARLPTPLPPLTLGGGAVAMARTHTSAELLAAIGTVEILCILLLLVLKWKARMPTNRQTEDEAKVSLSLSLSSNHWS